MKPGLKPRLGSTMCAAFLLGHEFADIIGDCDFRALLIKAVVDVKAVF